MFGRMIYAAAARTAYCVRALVLRPIVLVTLLLLAATLFLSLSGVGIYGPGLRVLISAIAGLAYYLGIALSVAWKDQRLPENFSRVFCLAHLPIPLFAASHLLLHEDSNLPPYIATLWPFAFIGVWLLATGIVFYLLHPKVLHRYLLVVVLGWGLYLRLLGLLTESLWFDELFALWRTRPELPMQEILSLSRKDVHPPLHYLSMWLWFKVFGVDPFSARITSVIGGLLGILAMYFLGKRAGGPWVAVTAAFVTCVSYVHVYYSQEFRSYIFLFAATAWCHWAFLGLLEKPSLRKALVYSAALLVTIYLHYYGFLVLLGQCVFLLLSPQRLLAGRGLLLRWYTAAIAIAAVCYLPWAGVVLNRLETADSWIRRPTPDFYVEFFQSYFRDQLLITIFLALIGGYLFFVLYANSQSAKEHNAPQAAIAGFCLVSVLIGWFAPYLHSINATPMLFDRYTIIVVPPIVLLVSLGIAHIQVLQIRVAVVVLIFYSATVGLFVHEDYYEKVDKMQIRELVGDLLEHPGAILAAHSYYYIDLSFYFDSLGPHPEPVTYDDAKFKEALMNWPASEPLEVWLFRIPVGADALNRATLDILKQFFFPTRQIDHYHASAVLYEYNEKIPRPLLQEYIAGDTRSKSDILLEIQRLNNSINWNQIGGQAPREETESAAPETDSAPQNRRPAPVRRPENATGATPSSQ